MSFFSSGVSGDFVTPVRKNRDVGKTNENCIGSHVDDVDVG